MLYPGGFHVSACRRCGNRQLYRAKPRWYHWFARLFLLHPVRCERCQTHSWRIGVRPFPDGRVKVKTKVKTKTVRRPSSTPSAVPDVTKP
jgi:hypothetical protein